MKSYFYTYGPYHVHPYDDAFPTADQCAYEDAQKTGLPAIVYEMKHGELAEPVAIWSKHD